MHGGEEPLRHSRTAVEIGRDERARLLSDVEPNGRGLGDDDPWLRKLHADRPTISARWTACPTRARVPIVRFWPVVLFRECPQSRSSSQRRATGLELEHHLSGGVGLHALVGQVGAGDVAT